MFREYKLWFLEAMMGTSKIIQKGSNKDRNLEIFSQ